MFKQLIIKFYYKHVILVYYFSFNVTYAMFTSDNKKSCKMEKI